MIQQRKRKKDRIWPPPSHSLSMVEEILHVARYRRALLTEEEDRCEANESYCLRRQVFRVFEDAISMRHGGDETKSDQENQNECKVNDEHTHFDFGNFLCFSRRIFGNLSAMDYCERVPYNLVWCGILQIEISQQGGTSDPSKDPQPIKVALVVHPRRWSMKEIRLWRNATTRIPSSSVTATKNHHVVAEGKQPTFKANVAPFDFLPVGPYRGRLVGLTASDRGALRKISDYLDRTDLVGTFTCTISSIAAKDATNIAAGDPPGIADHNTGRIHGGQFTVKLMGFDQAQRKIDTTFPHGFEPGGMSLSEEKNGMNLRPSEDANSDCVDYNRSSLLCCWNHEYLWEDFNSFRMETSYALRDTMKDYDRLVQ